jgi:hypothetical protein
MPDQNDFEAKINAEIEAGLATELAKKREDLAYQARRKAAMKELDRINQRHPIEGPYAGLTREQHEARLKAMSERAAPGQRGNGRRERKAGCGRPAGCVVGTQRRERGFQNRLNRAQT